MANIERALASRQLAASALLAGALFAGVSGAGTGALAAASSPTPTPAGPTVPWSPASVQAPPGGLSSPLGGIAQLSVGNLTCLSNADCIAAGYIASDAGMLGPVYPLKSNTTYTLQVNFAVGSHTMFACPLPPPDAGFGKVNPNWCVPRYPPFSASLRSTTGLG
jgi:hypothetical protein